MGWTSLFYSTLPKRPEAPFSMCYLVKSAIQLLSGHFCHHDLMTLTSRSSLQFCTSRWQINISGTSKDFPAPLSLDRANIYHTKNPAFRSQDQQVCVRLLGADAKCQVPEKEDWVDYASGRNLASSSAFLMPPPPTNGLGAPVAALFLVPARGIGGFHPTNSGRFNQSM